MWVSPPRFPGAETLIAGSCCESTSHPVNIDEPDTFLTLHLPWLPVWNRWQAGRSTPGQSDAALPVRGRSHQGCEGKITRGPK